MKKIGFIMPWYGDKIPGGAESACRSIVKHLSKKNIEVEVITTCAKDFKSNWSENFYKEGIYNESGIKISRFPVKTSNKKAFDEINTKLMKQEKISEAEEKIFFSNMISSPKLIEFLKIHQEEYHCFVFMPYMFQTIIEAIAIVPDKSVLIPCLHDEEYAKTKTIKTTFEKTRGIIYLSEPEKLLANKLYKIANTKQEVIGTFLSEPNNHSDPPKAGLSFRKKFKLEGDFILYAGRKDPGKNAELLAKLFIRYKKENPKSIIKLVYIGDESKFPFSDDNIIDLGFVERSEKYEAISEALFLCQPSIMESFSIVLMEAWLAGTPVLVNENCAVTKDFTRKSNGGLWFDGYNTFSKCMGFFLENKEKSQIIGSQGEKFVIENFSEDVLYEKFINFFINLYN